MYMLIFVLNDPDKLDDLLAAWEQTGINGVTILPSTGLGRIRQFEGYRDDIPIFPGLNDLYRRNEELSRTLFTVLKDENLLDSLIEITQKVVGDLNKPETGLLVILPTVRIVGLDKKQ